MTGRKYQDYHSQGVTDRYHVLHAELEDAVHRANREIKNLQDYIARTDCAQCPISCLFAEHVH